MFRADCNSSVWLSKYRSIILNQKADDCNGSKRAMPLTSSTRQIYLSKLTWRLAVGASESGQMRTRAPKQKCVGASRQTSQP